jgi:hypothetical protein
VAAAALRASKAAAFFDTTGLLPDDPPVEAGDGVGSATEAGGSIGGKSGNAPSSELARFVRSSGSSSSANDTEESAGRGHGQAARHVSIPTPHCGAQLVPKCSLQGNSGFTHASRQATHHKSGASVTVIGALRRSRPGHLLAGTGWVLAVQQGTVPAVQQQAGTALQRARTEGLQVHIADRQEGS